MEFLPRISSMEFLASLSAKGLTQLSFDEGLVKWRFIICISCCLTSPLILESIGKAHLDFYCKSEQNSKYTQ